MENIESGELARSKRILVVDDEEDVALVLQYVIEDGGYEVVTATTVADALVKVAERSFDAVVLDVQMGEASGLEVVSALRADPAKAALPIIVVSGLEERAVRKQFTDYELFVSKGGDLTLLIETLARVTGLGEKT